MRLKLTLLGGPGAGRQAAARDVMVTVEPSVTIGDLADALRRRDPLAGNERDGRSGPGGAAPPVTLALVDADRDPRPVPATFTLLEAGVRPGATVRVVPRDGDDGSAAGPVARRAAIVQVLEGPDAGRELELPVGTAFIGRGPSCEIRLTDPLVSRQHARLNITDVAEIVDSESINGVVVGGERVARAVLRAEDGVVLADTVLRVKMLTGAGAPASLGTAIGFNRSPVPYPLVPAREVVPPDLPTVPPRQRMQVAPMLAPVAMGIVLYFTTHSALSFLMVGITPVMYLGNFLESSASRRRALASETATFRAALEELDAELERSAADERTARLRAHPAVGDVASAVDGLTPLVWSRRPGEPGFLEVRVGAGTLPSRTTVADPENARQRGEGLASIAAVRARHASVDGVPVTVSMGEGALGVVGGSPARELAASVLMQVVALHSPAEVVVAVVASPASAPTWDWLKWTPHVTSPASPISAAHLAATPGECAALAGALEELCGAADHLPAPRVVVLVEDDAPLDRDRLVALAEHGAVAGVHVLWCAPAVEQLPAACRRHVEVDALSGGTRFVDLVARTTVDLDMAERLATPDALRLARRLSPLVDLGARVDDASDLPPSVSFAALAGPELLSSPEVVVERWKQNQSIVDRSPGASQPRRKPGGLRALVGRAAAEVLHLDLRADGPHALVGGTTGSGKSELLQAWIVAMATAYSPDRVTFLLVDYKGGSAFQDFDTLPHRVGTVTDLSGHLAQRALVSLRAELRHREHILARKRAKDLATLEMAGDAEAPPSLVIVIDEFAALVQEMPEFVDGVVDVAQRGRSLGLHLILATQRPGGVIKESLRANTNLRIALRVADEHDSLDVLGVPAAAGFDPLAPGRAMAKIGPRRLVAFQAAYAGGCTPDTPPPPAIVVEDLVFGAARRWEEPEPPAGDAPAPAPVAAGVAAAGVAGPAGGGGTEDAGPATDVRRLVASIVAAAHAEQVPAPRRPWRDELRPVYDLADLLEDAERSDERIVFGRCDDPERQDQPAAAFAPESDGNLAVYGTGGSGKSTALRTIGTAAGVSHEGGPCWVYGLDFGARGLDALVELPHVGAIVRGEDDERVARLLRWLRDLIAERAERFRSADAASLGDYRRRAGRPAEPRILLLVDGIGAFREAYELGERARLFETFAQVVRDGRTAGVHVVVTADRPGAMPSAVASAIHRILVLRMATPHDAATLGVPTRLLDGESPPGRGVQDKLELQVGVLGGSASLADEVTAIRELAVTMRRSIDREAPPPVGRMPTGVSLGELPAEQGGWPVVGVDEGTLGPCTIVPRGSFVVTGPSESGRTTTLATIVTAVRRWRPGTRFAYIGTGTSILTSLVEWQPEPAIGPVAAGEAAAALVGELAGVPGGRSDGEADRLLVVVIENAADFVGTVADAALQQLVAAVVTRGHFVLVDGDPGALGAGWPLTTALRISRYGIALQPEQMEGGVFKTSFPRVSRGQFPKGRGLLVRAGLTSVVQLALPDLLGAGDASASATDPQLVDAAGSSPHAAALSDVGRTGILREVTKTERG